MEREQTKKVLGVVTGILALSVSIMNFVYFIYSCLSIDPSNPTKYNVAFSLSMVLEFLFFLGIGFCAVLMLLPIFDIQVWIDKRAKLIPWIFFILEIIFYFIGFFFDGYKSSEYWLHFLFAILGLTIIIVSRYVQEGLLAKYFYMLACVIGVVLCIVNLIFSMGGIGIACAICELLMFIFLGVYYFYE